MSASPGEPSARVRHMTERARDAWDRGEFFLFLRIPEPLRPEDRGERYEDPIDEALQTAGLGRVVGGGQQLGPGGTIAYCGVDVVLIERVRGLELIREILVQLNAPPATVIEEFLPRFTEHSLVEPPGD